ncbi:MGDG synthase family glycosyltransferase [Virgibacillus senegalensis]|uniref:MGDG synthase family glycosyltransferase n=1 Tax=Virgibacillus senegalensis TaxID=1499679 RepID=UPI00069E1CD6|nr:hypothetical protein [Virgibacillus senegalensis]
MKKLLFLPFLQLPSGHHQVADTLIEHIQEIDSQFVCKKVDPLAYTFGKLERVISGTYLKWIHYLPQTYSWLYHKTVYNDRSTQENYPVYDLLFSKAFEKLLEEEQPDAVICTHSLPSYIIGRLKEKKNLRMLLINVYTDFFAHQMWETNGADMHFVSSHLFKEDLIQKGVNPNTVFITGIPTHKAIQPSDFQIPCHDNPCLLITGGSLGVGGLKQLLGSMTGRKGTYLVLCGKNQKLYNTLKKEDNQTIRPLSYIESREQMDDIYNQVDGIISKPGGVTISECVKKRKPVFVYHALPGQEEINLKLIKQLGIGIESLGIPNLERRISQYFNDARQASSLEAKIDAYHHHISVDPTLLLYERIKEQP